jgi:cyclic pyranopterin phosphate synthase
MLTHIDKNNLPTMVDITDKKVTERVATASAKVILPQNIVDLFDDGDLTTKKGPVIQTAIIAGTMAVKKTSELIPFCHPHRSREY